MTQTISHPSRTRRRAMTLLEVVLTLALSVTLIALVGGAIRYYGIEMGRADAEIRQTHLAAALMQMIEDDLRSTLRSPPFDAAGFETLLLSMATGNEQLLAEEDLSAAGMEDAEVESSTDADLTTASTIALAEPGLIGNTNQIQIDLSRLPRLEDSMRWIDGNTADFEDVPSDLKTVTYFVQPAGAVGVRDELAELAGDAGTDDVSGQDDAGGGLIRRSLDRAATTFAAQTGGLTRLNTTGEVLAPEVLAIEFEYFDGILWQIMWNSDEMGQLPLAVRVTITMAPVRQSVDDGSDGPKFRHVVRLPMARPVEDEEADVASGLGTSGLGT